MESLLVFRLLFLVLSCAGKTDSIRRSLAWNSGPGTPMERLHDLLHPKQPWQERLQEWRRNPSSPSSSSEADSRSEQQKKVQEGVMLGSCFIGTLGVITTSVTMFSFWGHLGGSCPQALLVALLAFLTLLVTGCLACQISKTNLVWTVPTVAFGSALAAWTGYLPHDTAGHFITGAWNTNANDAFMVVMVLGVPMFTVLFMLLVRRCKYESVKLKPGANLFVENFAIITTFTALVTTGLAGGASFWMIWGNSAIFGISLGVFVSLLPLYKCLTQHDKPGAVQGFFTNTGSKIGVTAFCTLSTFFLVALPFFGWDSLGYGVGTVIICFIPIFFLLRGGCVRGGVNNNDLLWKASLFKAITVAGMFGSVSGIIFNIADPTLKWGTMNVGAACGIIFGGVCFILLVIAACKKQCIHENDFWKC